MTRLARSALGIGGAAVVVAVLIAIGVQSEFAWAWGMLAVAVFVLFALRMPDDPRADAPGRTLDNPYLGSDVSRLAWAINRSDDAVGEAVTRRVRATLRRRLARHGVDVDDEAHRAQVERMLGRGIWAGLHGRRTRIADLRAALEAAERIGREQLPGRSVHADHADSRESTP